MRFTHPFHPLLIAIYPVLFLYSQNASLTSFHDAWPAGLAALAAVGALWVLSHLFLKSAERSALLASAIFLLFAVYGHLHSYLVSFVLELPFFKSPDLHRARQVADDLHVLLSCVWLAFIVFAVRVLSQRRKAFPAVTRFANVASLTLTALALIPLFQARPQAEVAQNANLSLPPAYAERSALPDIYYIILDEYARHDMLWRYYGFDNAPFLAFLRERGFVVLPDAESNYAHTFLSLASSLNFEYLQNLSNDPDRDFKNWAFVFSLIRNSRAARLLKSLGYRYLHFDSTWAATIESPLADRNISCDKTLAAVPFYRAIMNTTWLSTLTPLISGDLAKCRLSQLASMETVAGEAGPKFVFSHLVLPHFPYLFDKDGNTLGQVTLHEQFDEVFLSAAEHEDLYLGQLEYLNKRLRGIIEKILEESAAPPIIILQADHGSHVFELKGEFRKRARHAIFAAIYFAGTAGSNPGSFNDPINIVRETLNRAAATKLGPLPHKSFFSSWQEPFNFEASR